MIIKLSERKTGSTEKLANYILDEKNGGEKVGASWSVNCVDDLDFAVKEIEFTQSQNTRTKLNKTWHIIVSFDKKHIDHDDLREIENKVCEGLGMESHQRIVSVHTDTENLHFHIALNRICPDTFKMINPSHSKYKLQDVGAEIEKEYGLSPTIGDAVNSKAENSKYGWEHVTGHDSLATWVKDNCKDEMAKASSWAELHDVMRANGLAYHLKGAGACISTRAGEDDVGYTIKSSGVGREYSLNNMSKVLGVFAPDIAQSNDAKSKYTRGPSGESAKLWGDYQEYRKSQKSKYISSLDRLRGEKKSKQSALKSNMQAARAKVNVSGALRGAKRASYSRLKVERMIASEDIKSVFADDVIGIKEKLHTMSWPEYVSQQAREGDIVAKRVAAYHSRKNMKIIGNGFSISPANGFYVPKRITRPVGFTVKKRGVVEYRLQDGSTVVDAGRKIQVDVGLSELAVDTALMMAVNSYGSNLAVATEELQERLVEAAKSRNMVIRINGEMFGRDDDSVRSNDKTGAKDLKGNNRADGGDEGEGEGRGR